MKNIQPIDLIKVLLEKQFISQDQLHIAELESENKKINVLQAIIQLDFISLEIIHKLQHEEIEHPKVNLVEILIDASLLQAITQHKALQYICLPIALNQTEKILTVATANPHNLPAFDDYKILIKNYYNFYPDIETMIASQDDVLEAIQRHYRHQENHQLSLDNTQNERFAQQFVDHLLIDAIQKNASDIHIQPEEHSIRLRYRIDGVLHQQKMYHKQFLSALTNRLKIMAKADIAEQRNTQDGHFQVQINSRQIDIRISFLPTIHGENIVLRLLNKKKNLLDLNHLCILEWQKDLIQQLLAKPTGLILLTGPTGSGKTTTLYAMLNQLNQIDKHIVTLEDPVEYMLPMINQVNLNDAIKFNFAEGIRAILRQDPDIILIGEIRDEETAQMAFRASMTGHQVYSTLHTNSAIGAFGRLLDMNISRTVLSDQNINGIINQRLIRKLCTYCKKINNNFYEVNPNGCPYCHHTGYYGQFSLMEILPMTRELEFLIDQNASSKELMEYLNHPIESKFIPLNQVAKQFIESGMTTIQEIQRCTGYLLDF